MSQFYEDLLVELDALSLAQLKNNLQNDDYKKAFWINIYNAHFQILRKQFNLKKPEIYKDRMIKISGNTFSLDEVEHGILRRNRHKLSLGYLPNPFSRKIITDLAVEKLDYRIHFALNCGAESCPPIAFYSADKIAYQLELSTLSFLESETKVDEQKKEISVSKLFQWYRADFDGTKGIRIILKEKLKLDTTDFKLKYNEYSWNEDLENYTEHSF